MAGHKPWSELEKKMKSTKACEPEQGAVCPACGGSLQMIRLKLICSRCHTIVETCCDGGSQR